MAVQEVQILQGSGAHVEMVFHQQEQEEQEEEERRSFIKMQTSESEPSTAPSTARSESSDSMNSLTAEKLKTSLSRNEEEGKERCLPEFQRSLVNDNEHVQKMPVTPLNILEVLDDIIDVDETSHDGFWDTSDEDAFVENKNKLMQKVRKVTVVQTSSPWSQIGQQQQEESGGFANFGTLASSEQEQEKEGEDGARRKRSEEFFSQDSLEQGTGEEERTHLMSSSSCASSTEEEEEDTDKVSFCVMCLNAPLSPFQSQLWQNITLPVEVDLAESHLAQIFGFSGIFLQTFATNKISKCKKYFAVK